MSILPELAEKPVKKSGLQDVSKVDEFLSSHGFKRLGDYLGVHVPMQLQRPCGHVCSMSLHDCRATVRKNRECLQCIHERANANRTKTLEQIRAEKEVEVIKEFISVGCTPLSKFENTNKPFEWLCPKGHLVKSCVKSFRRYRDHGTFCCKRCSGRAWYQDEIIQALSERGCQYISHERLGKLNNRTNVRYVCPFGHPCRADMRSILNSEFHSCQECVWQSRRRDAESEELHQNILRIRSRIGARLYSQIRRLEKGCELKINSKTLLARQIIDRYGFPPTGYHIDHVVPVSFFSPYAPPEVEACWSVDNLRYLSASDNSRRSNKLTFEEFALFTEAQFKIFELASLKPNYCRKWKLKKPCSLRLI